MMGMAPNMGADEHMIDPMQMLALQFMMEAAANGQIDMEFEDAQ